SDTSTSGVISGDSRRTASRAAAPRARSTKYSDWISSPLLGGESIRECGTRSGPRRTPPPVLGGGVKRKCGSLAARGAGRPDHREVVDRGVDQPRRARVGVRAEE